MVVPAVCSPVVAAHGSPRPSGVVVGLVGDPGAPTAAARGCGRGGGRSCVRPAGQEVEHARETLPVSETKQLTSRFE